jgi:glycosyltransferase involved in cell wall biosynthesis
MHKNVPICLPNLADYRQAFTQQGVITPLATVPFSEAGLLADLPSPPPGKTGWPWTVETQPMPETMPNGKPWAKISIVTPSYNQGQFIEETIRSVLLQNYPNLEFIVIDGGSDDETKDILEKYSPWLSFWQSKGDRGQGHAINLGFSLANGDYLGWLNSDDFYTPTCLQRVAECFRVRKIKVVYGDAFNLDQETGTYQYWQANLVLDRYLRFGGIIASHAAFWQRQVHEPIWEELHCAVDAELWLRLIPNHPRSHLCFPLGIARSHPETKTNNDCWSDRWQKDYNENIFRVYEPAQFWKFRCYEYRWVQEIYKRLCKILAKQTAEQILLNDLGRSK